MRDIKFRVYDTVNKCFITDISNFWINLHFSHTCEWRPELDGQTVFDLNDSLVFQQYTGLKDKNGQEIYEGDILGYPENYNDERMMEIRWAEAYSGEQWCEFEIRNYKGQYVPGGKLSDFYGGVHPDYMIVVGNIFEGVDK